MCARKRFLAFALTSVRPPARAAALFKLLKGKQRIRHLPGLRTRSLLVACHVANLRRTLYPVSCECQEKVSELRYFDLSDIAIGSNIPASITVAARKFGNFSELEKVGLCERLNVDFGCSEFVAC